MKTIAIFLLLVIVFENPLFSQNKYNFAQLRDETVDFIKQPSKWERNDWLKLGLIGAGTFLVMQADQPIRDALMKDQSYYKSFPVEFGKLWGETYSTAIVAGMFGLHGILADDKTTKKVGFEIIQAALYSGGITSILKFAFGRARPFMNKSSADYQPFTLLDDGLHSFPSGHTTLAFALSTILSRNSQSSALKVLAFVPAALTVFSRVYQDYHWTSDCLLSAVVGFVVATWVVDLHDQKESQVQVSSVYPLTIRINLD
ncbi:MAG: phosphatase PAP2 family protein [Ignavibacteriales bacterium]|nr:phosphatase PAP2 family protein [Ignavibacteriales bacterium]